jgi:hypothetical protein
MGTKPHKALFHRSTCGNYNIAKELLLLQAQFNIRSFKFQVK